MPICSFCGKLESEVFNLIASRGQKVSAAICNECVELCHDMNRQAKISAAIDVPPDDRVPLVSWSSFDYQGLALEWAAGSAEYSEGIDNSRTVVVVTVRHAGSVDGGVATLFQGGHLPSLSDALKCAAKHIVRLKREE